MRRWLCWLLCLLLTASALGCAPLPISPYSVTWLDVFDTVTNLTVYGVDEAACSTGSAQIHERLAYYHRLFDIYHTYKDVNNLKTVNDAAGGQPVAVEAPILDLLEYSLEAYRLTDGRVNVLFGPVLKLWHDSRVMALETPAKAALPDPKSLEQAARHTDPSVLVIDREAGTVCLTDPQARLDVGAIAKGFAAELVARYVATELAWQSVLLDVGGNVRAIGGKPGLTGPQPFTIGVRNPNLDSAQAYLLTVGITDRAAVTSGDYQRFFVVDGQRYAHIIDVDTLQPAAYVRSVTVICPDSGLADVLSTALFTLSVEEGRDLLGKHKNAEAVWVLTDGTLAYSTDFDQYMK